MNTIFFDATCPLCQNAVKKIKKLDVHHRFHFEPLPKKWQHANTMILQEGKRIYARGKAVFRIFYLLGGKWRLLGLLGYLPGIDYAYNFVARHRHHFYVR